MEDEARGTLSAVRGGRPPAAGARRGKTVQSGPGEADDLAGGLHGIALRPVGADRIDPERCARGVRTGAAGGLRAVPPPGRPATASAPIDPKSTRLNSSHLGISY